MRPHRRTGREQPAAEYFAALQRQSRPRRWVAALVLGAAEGLIMGLVLPWRLALLVALVTVIGLLLWDSRHGTLAGLWPGDPGLHRLAAATAHLERRGWVVLRNPRIPNLHILRPTYLLIGPGGVFGVEHQVWTVADTVATSPTTGLLLVRGRPAARRTASIRAMTAAIGEVMSDTCHTVDIDVQPVLAVDGKTLDQQRDTVGVTLLPVADLTRFLRRGEVMLSDAKITALADTARRAFPPG